MVYKVWVCKLLPLFTNFRPYASILYKLLCVQLLYYYSSYCDCSGEVQEISIFSRVYVNGYISEHVFIELKTKWIHFCYLEYTVQKLYQRYSLVFEPFIFPSRVSIIAKMKELSLNKLTKSIYSSILWLG